jgi:ribosome maturation factor RimP
MQEEILLKNKPVLEATLEKLGFCLVDMRIYKNHFGQCILEVLADRIEGGITLDECSRLNKELGSMLEQEGGLNERYTLDISSPGMDRPLMTLADFRRVCGRELRLFLKEKYDGKIEIQGTLESVSDNQMIVKTKDTTIQVSLDKINKAKQVIA